MNRPNFYHLLGISINPPETDPQKIELAIRKKQAEWSRYRNHPTKGMQARQYMGLIADINLVMADPDLREKEVRKARDILIERAREKLLSTDRHVALLLSKGSITAEEITWLANKYRIKKRTVFRRVQVNNRGKLAKIDLQLETIAKKRKIKKRDINKIAKQQGVDTAIIEGRIEADIEKKFAEIDRYLNVRTTKEYITDEELSGLAKLFRTPESEILRRVKCPIRKKSEIDTDKAMPLDKTIEHVIEENLKITAKTSLYDFLGLWLGSSLESLQKRAQEKEAEIRRLGQKNVFATASGILAGHCISIFKSAESRNTYDLSKARSRLKELNPDIEVAGLNGTVRSEYMEVLVRQAVGYGVDPEEAMAYIHRYCGKQGWEVEVVDVENQKQRRPVNKKLLAAAAIVMTFVLISASYFLKGSLTERHYKELLEEVAQQSNLEKKLGLLTRYQMSNKNSEYAQEINQRIDSIDKKVGRQRLQQATVKADSLISQRRFAEAETVYAGYLAKYPNSPFRDNIAAKKSKIPILVEDDRFDSLLKIPEDDYDKRIAAYSDYLSNYPEGRHRDEIIKLLLAMQSPFFAHIQARAAACDEQQVWEPCTRLCDMFIQIYEGSKQARELGKLKQEMQNHFFETQEFDNLKMQAQMAGSDRQAGRQIYTSYLAKHPNASTRKKIESEIAAFDLEKKNALLARTRGRFVENRPGVVTDTTTGLMWALNDSQEDLDTCLTYKAARKYVANLTTGGFTDWRLPTPEELGNIYKKRPFFPFSGGKWLWSSKSYKRYSDGWFQVVDIVTTDKTGGNVKITRHEKECGAVRALRP